MHVSSRVSNISESVTLKLNAQAQALSDSGVRVFNLTAGQLPFRPLSEFSDSLRHQLDFLKSYQYSPVAGFSDTRAKIKSYMESSRGLDEGALEQFDVLISNGGKHSLSVVFDTLLDEGDEVVLLTPYWVSYTEMIKLAGAKTVVVDSTFFDNYTPRVEDIEKAITPKTRAIVVNSPNNPSGLHYSEAWMRDFAALLMKHQHVNVVSDEIYFELSYYDPKPTYFYQFEKSLLERTIMVSGISKILASTGLRLGFSVAPKAFVKAAANLQGQTASGASSLVQRALSEFDFDHIENFLSPVKKHLQGNAEILRESFREASLGTSWYQTLSAFYSLIDFSQTPVIERYRKSPTDLSDYSTEICSELLEKKGVAIVPASDFGLSNAARISLVLPKDDFASALGLLLSFLKGD